MTASMMMSGCSISWSTLTKHYVSGFDARNQIWNTSESWTIIECFVTYTRVMRLFFFLFFLLRFSSSSFFLFLSWSCSVLYFTIFHFFLPFLLFFSPSFFFSIPFTCRILDRIYKYSRRIR